MIQTKMHVVSQKKIANNIYELILSGKNTHEMSPGQFLMVKPKQTHLLLRRPISIASYEKEEETCTLLYRTIGSGTKSLAELQKGDHVDVIGPLGNGFQIDESLKGKQALLIGGGIGVPPMYQLGKELYKIGANVTFVNGFTSIKDVFYEKEMQSFGDVFITTLDGTKGTKGLVTAVTNDLSLKPDIVFSCGPSPMLRAIKTRFKETRTFLSLEERMACGIGACYACVCKKEDGGQFKVCSDGPVFCADEVEI